MRPLLVLALLAPSARASTIAVPPYLQDVRTDGVTVMWESDEAVAGEVVVALPTGAKRFASPAGTHHEVRLSGLPPGHYRYHVEQAGAAPTAEAELATAPTGSELTFLVYGDNRDRDAEHARVVAAMAKERAELILQTGDMTGDAGEEPLWRRFFAIEQPLLSQSVMYPALGNHELLHDPTASHFHRYFALPGPDTERYYSFRFASALFIALDGNESHSRPQAEWLARTLDAAAADPAVRHLFVFFHQPPFSVGDFCGSAAEQGLWVPELERAAAGKLRAVFTGHDHSYQRLERNGVRYFVSGGGAPLHHQSAHCPPYDRQASKLFHDAYHYMKVRIRGEQVLADAISVDGETIDSQRLHEGPVLEGEPPPAVPFVDAPLRPPPPRPSGRGSWIPLAVLGVPALVALLAFAILRLRRQR